uniref:Uncharacterized protein n=1 Tax=viral metagenome TaxID=1070528 RepID=A0A6M3XHH9_9ZZZZ
MVIGYIKDAKEHIEAAIENLEKFIDQADPQNEEAEATLNEIDYVTKELWDFWMEFQDVFHKIIGG